MKLRWHGHSCFEIKDGVTVVTDPHDGKSLGIAKPQVKANVVLVSHDHFDHNCSRIVKGLDTEVVSTPGKTRKSGLDIIGIETFHDDSSGKKRGTNIVFRFSIGGLTYCHMGDLGDMPPDSFYDEIGHVDILMIPVGNVFTIGAEQAKTIITKLNPRVAIPMHYRVRGLSLSIKPVDDFLGLFPEEKITYIGNEIDFIHEDLPTENEIWVFSL